MEIFIKNMVCDRCISRTREIFEKLGILNINISLGKVVLADERVSFSWNQLESEMKSEGFELVMSPKEAQATQVRSFLIRTIFSNDTEQLRKQKISSLLEHEFQQDYGQISASFSSSERITIERFVILLKIERAKELLSEGILSNEEIAFKLAYNSAQHFSNRFKAETGITPGNYRRSPFSAKIALDKVG